MGFSIKVQSVEIEHVKKGPRGYNCATVSYFTSKGEGPRTHKIMDFANPAVFKSVQQMKEGETWQISSSKNEAGYNQWVEALKDGEATPSSKGTSTPVGKTSPVAPSRGFYETPEERALRQLMIVRQSSLSNAVAVLTAANKVPDLEEVLEMAEVFVQFVFKSDVAPTPSPEIKDLMDEPNDIPE